MLIALFCRAVYVVIECENGKKCQGQCDSLGKEKIVNRKLYFNLLRELTL